MKLLRWGWRAARWCGLALLVAVVLTLAFAYGSQWLLRWRAERLMAEMHRVRLYQSTWEDAQGLMHEWGEWGHYDGSCTRADCRYEITFGWPVFGVSEPGAVTLWLVRTQAWMSRLLPGIRLSTLRVRFVVHGGTIWRESALVVVDVPPKFGHEEVDYSLIVRTKSEDRLRRSSDDPWILGGDAQLGEHPYYKAGRPSGCTNCMAAQVTYSTHTPQSQIDELTDFDFSCFTRWRPCRWLGDVLPKAWEWRLYSYFEPGKTPIMEVPAPPWPCDIPLWALGRDFNTVMSVETLGTERRRERDESYDVTRIRVDDVLKGAAWRKGITLEAIPFQPQHDWRDDGVAESMEAGKRYLLLWDDWRDDPPLPSMELRRCGVQEDVPAARAELAKGFAQNDGLRVKEW